MNENVIFSVHTVGFRFIICLYISTSHFQFKRTKNKLVDKFNNKARIRPFATSFRFFPLPSTSLYFISF